MFNVLSRRLQHCNKVAVNINNAAPTQLQQIKTQLAEEMGKPVGLHTMGIPAAVSTLGVIVSFAIPQLWLGYGILTALDQPAERVFVWVVLVALLFAGLNGVTMFMIGKGSMRAVRLHFTLTVISLLLTAAYLLAALSESTSPGVSLTAALVCRSAAASAGDTPGKVEGIYSRSPSLIFGKNSPPTWLSGQITVKINKAATNRVAFGQWRTLISSG